MDIKKILDKIAKRRKKKGYSYENMAEDLALTPSGYRKIETGETKLSVERMLQIATVLDLSVRKPSKRKRQTNSLSKKSIA